MSRQPEDVLKVRVDIIQTDWELVEEVARISMTTPRAVLRLHLMELRAALRKGGTTVKLTEAWTQAYANLDKVALETQLKGDAAEVDLRLLHTSRKLASGFEGVYVHPTHGFIAQGRDPGTRKPGVHLGLFPTAVQAAWARYKHYRDNGLPYGKLEELMEQFAQDQTYRSLNLHLPKNEHWLRRVCIWTLYQKGIVLSDLPDSERHWQDNNPISSSLFDADVPE